MIRQPVGSRKAREFERRETEILRVALDCFSGEDWESATVARIADLVGIAKGTMYLHFASKQDIYARLTLNFYQALLANLRKVSEDGRAGRLAQLIDRAFQFYLNQPKYRSVTQYCAREDFRSKMSDELAKEFDEVDNALHQLLRHELEAGIASGVYQSACIDQSILGLQCTFHGALTMLWCNRHGEQDSAQQFIKSITQYMLAPILVTGHDQSCEHSSRHPMLEIKPPESTHE